MNNLYQTSNQSHIETADALFAQGRFPEAADYYREALKANDKDYVTFIKMGEAILAQRIPALYPISLACYEKSLQLHGDNPDAYLKKGNILKKLGRQAEATLALQHAIQLHPEPIRARFKNLAIQCPILYQKQEDIVSHRAAYEQQLEELSNTLNLLDPATIEGAAQAVGEYPFHLAYQGYNDKELQHRYGELVCRIQAARYPQWSQPLPTPPLNPGEPLRVGIVSGFFYYHATWKILTRGWLQSLDRNRFALYGYYTGHRADACTDYARKAVTRFVEHPASLESMCQQIMADKLHVLLYPEIGMDRMVVRLAALRLAPVQCLAWGHSTTSGLPTMDYYLSSQLMEPTNGADHYTETLVPLPNLGIYYAPGERETTPVEPVEPIALGLKKDAVIYLCMQSLFKYLPPYDEVFPRIAQQAGNCQFVFITGKMSKPLVDILRGRLARVFARYGLNSENYLVFFPRLADLEYWRLYLRGDVFLDSFGWSGCNTTMDAVAYHLPVVTCPGPLMRGRQSMAILRMMGVTATIADSVDHYVEIAAKLGTDSPWRSHIRQQMAAHSYKLHGDKTASESLQLFLEKAVADSRQL